MNRTVRDIPEMYSEMMNLLRYNGKREDSRNGPVISIEEPLLIAVMNPKIRANVDPIRNANPFFHLMEFVWMMAGYNSPDWISQFNKRFVEYADVNNFVGKPQIHGAYGYRWRHHFGRDQIQTCVSMLKKDHTTRRAVLAMWNPTVDLNTEHNDLPCNTHIYLRIIDGGLDFTVCNRSNDVIWGMTGANAVHMTLLQELMANAIGVDVGVYRVFTINAHVYTGLPGVQEMLETRDPCYVNYTLGKHIPLLGGQETLAEFLDDCENCVKEGHKVVATRWINEVAIPVHELWEHREVINSTIMDNEWEQACTQWLQRK
jgi:thymidylate synthase